MFFKSVKSCLCVVTATPGVVEDGVEPNWGGVVTVGCVGVVVLAVVYIGTVGTDGEDVSVLKTNLMLTWWCCVIQLFQNYSTHCFDSKKGK